MGLLRVLLALSVAFGHLSDRWPKVLTGVGGIVAVEAFFLVSGYYMSLVLSTSYVGRRGAFYLNRALRILPEYWIIALLGAIWGSLVVSSLEQSAAEQADIVSRIASLTNVTVVGQDLFQFLGRNSSGFCYLEEFGCKSVSSLLLVPQAWTLSLELLFYIAAPSLVRASTRNLVMLMVALLFTKFIFAGWVLGLGDPWHYRLVVFEFAYFIGGMLLHRSSYSLVEFTRSLGLGTRRQAKVALLGVILLIAPGARFVGVAVESIWIQGDFVRFYVIPALLVFLIALLVPLLFAVTHDDARDRRLGEWSYPIYLSHMLAFKIADDLHIVFPPVGIAGPSAHLLLTALFAGGLVWVGRRIEGVRSVVKKPLA